MAQKSFFEFILYTKFHWNMINYKTWSLTKILYLFSILFQELTLYWVWVCLVKWSQNLLDCVLPSDFFWVVDSFEILDILDICLYIVIQNFEFEAYHLKLPAFSQPSQTHPMDICHKVLRKSRHLWNAEHNVFLKWVLYIFNKYFFMATIYIQGVYAVVKN